MEARARGSSPSVRLVCITQTAESICVSNGGGSSPQISSSRVVHGFRRMRVPCCPHGVGGGGPFAEEYSITRPSLKRM